MTLLFIAEKLQSQEPQCAFDKTLSLELNIKEVTRVAFFHLNIAKIRSALTEWDSDLLNSSAL